MVQELQQKTSWAKLIFQGVQVPSKVKNKATPAAQEPEPSLQLKEPGPYTRFYNLLPHGSMKLGLVCDLKGEEPI